MFNLRNNLWLLLGSGLVWIYWYLLGITAFVFILGIPWVRASFVGAKFIRCPFDKDMVSRAKVTGKQDLGTGTLGKIGNLMWFVFFGWWLCVIHLILAVFFYITVIGIPFAKQHIKIAKFTIAPIGKMSISSPDK